MSEKTIVIALGGNALLQRGQKGTFEEQAKNVDAASVKIADLIVAGHKVVLTHGNGPQVGATLLRHEAAKNVVPPFPLYACGAETQGFIGYMIQQSLRNELKSRGVPKYAISLVTRTVVSKDDPAFQNPSKPVGQFYTKEEAEKFMAQRPDLVFKEDAGRGYRRCVPSPNPGIIVERTAIRKLVDSGFVVVANGGGGIPVIEEGMHTVGVEAVIDKDLGGQRLATLINADIFMIMTDVDGVCLNYGTPKQELLREATPKKLREYMKEGHFKAGSMAPKVEAAARFVESGGERAVIAHLNTILKAFEGQSGTQVTSQRANP